jgi:glycosyltransferase involved in cell wall biosynthesis
LNDAMRILHLAPFLWSGAGQVIASLCESQAAHHTVAIVTTGRSGGHRDWPAYRRRLSRAGAMHTPIDLFHRDAETFWRGVDTLRRLVRNWQPDLVHAHAGVPACAAAAVRSAGLSFALVNHVYSWGLNRPAWMNDMDLAGHRQADLVICSATAYEKVLIDAGIPRRRLVNVPWGLAPATLAATAEPLRRATSGPRIGLVGRVEPRKGQLELVRGFAAARAHLPAARLELVGPIADEEYAAEIRREIAGRGLEKIVRLRGHVRNVAAIVRRWDLCVSLSQDEGQGLALLEAMALGVPVAARPVAGIEDYFRPGQNGFAVRSARPSDVAEALAGAFSDPVARARAARRGQRLARERFSWDRTVRTIEQLYGRASCA